MIAAGSSPNKRSKSASNVLPESLTVSNAAGRLCDVNSSAAVGRLRESAAAGRLRVTDSASVGLVVEYLTIEKPVISTVSEGTKCGTCKAFDSEHVKNDTRHAKNAKPLLYLSMINANNGPNTCTTKEARNVQTCKHKQAANTNRDTRADTNVKHTQADAMIRMQTRCFW